MFNTLHTLFQTQYAERALVASQHRRFSALLALRSPWGTAHVRDIMRMHDEPILGPAFDRPLTGEHEDPALPERIRQLVNDQPYAVLCTQGDGQP